MDDATVDAVKVIAGTKWGAYVTAVLVIGFALVKLVSPAQSAIRDWMLGMRRTTAAVKDHDTVQLQAEIERLAGLVETLQETIDAMQRRERARDRAAIAHMHWDRKMIQAAIAAGGSPEPPPDLWGVQETTTAGEQK